MELHIAIVCNNLYNVYYTTILNYRNHMVVTSNRIKVKFFVGCLLTPDIEMKLHRSQAWKQSRIGTESNGTTLCEVYFQEKKYLGLFLDKPMASLSEFKILEKQVGELLAGYCPELAAANVKIFIFSQIFIQ